MSDMSIQEAIQDPCRETGRPIYISLRKFPSHGLHELFVSNNDLPHDEEELIVFA